MGKKNDPKFVRFVARMTREGWDMHDIAELATQEGYRSAYGGEPNADIVRAVQRGLVMSNKLKAEDVSKTRRVNRLHQLQALQGQAVPPPPDGEPLAVDVSRDLPTLEEVEYMQRWAQQNVYRDKPASIDGAKAYMHPILDGPSPDFASDDPDDALTEEVVGDILGAIAMSRQSETRFAVRLAWAAVAIAVIAAGLNIATALGYIG